MPSAPASGDSAAPSSVSCTLREMARIRASFGASVVAGRDASTERSSCRFGSDDSLFARDSSRSSREPLADESAVGTRGVIASATAALDGATTRGASVDAGGAAELSTACDAGGRAATAPEFLRKTRGPPSVHPKPAEATSAMVTSRIWAFRAGRVRSGLVGNAVGAEGLFAQGHEGTSGDSGMRSSASSSREVSWESSDSVQGRSVSGAICSESVAVRGGSGGASPINVFERMERGLLSFIGPRFAPWRAGSGLLRDAIGRKRERTRV